MGDVTRLLKIRGQKNPGTEKTGDRKIRGQYTNPGTVYILNPEYKSVKSGDSIHIKLNFSFSFNS